VSTSQAYGYFSQFEEAGLEFKAPVLAQTEYSSHESIKDKLERLSRELDEV
jgi:hypothetical protein